MSTRFHDTAHRLGATAIATLVLATQALAGADLQPGDPMVRITAPPALRAVLLRVAARWATHAHNAR
jgi:hypothetical protein